MNQWCAGLKSYASCVPPILHGLGWKDHNPYQAVSSDDSTPSCGTQAMRWGVMPTHGKILGIAKRWIRKENCLKSYEAAPLQQNSGKATIKKSIRAQMELSKLMVFKHNILATCKQFLNTVLRRFTTLIPFHSVSWKIELIWWSVSPEMFSKS